VEKERDYQHEVEEMSCNCYTRPGLPAAICFGIAAYWYIHDMAGWGWWIFLGLITL